MARQFIDRRPIDAGTDSLATARCLRDAFVAELERTHGPTVGYKVALTGRALRERLGIADPLYGYLLRDMLLRDGARVSADYAARPLVEPDLLIVLRDGEIDGSETPLQLAGHVAEVRPFVELADLLLAAELPITAANVTAVNAGARLGVMGKALPVESPKDLERALSRLRVELVSSDGEVLSAGGPDPDGPHLLEWLGWLARNLAEEGRTLNAGDIISLGSLGPAIEPRPGLQLEARYHGLASETGSVSLSFE